MTHATKLYSNLHKCLSAEFTNNYIHVQVKFAKLWFYVSFKSKIFKKQDWCMDKSCFIGNFFLRFIIRFGNKIHTICTNFPCSLDQMTSATICLSLQLSTAICSMIVTILRLSIIIADSLHQISSISDSKTLIITTLSYNLPCCYCNHHILLPVVQCIKTYSP